MGAGKKVRGGGTRGRGQGLRADPFEKSSGSWGGGQGRRRSWRKKARREAEEESLTEGEGGYRARRLGGRSEEERKAGLRDGQRGEVQLEVHKWQAAVPLHTAYSPKTRSHCPPPRALQHPSLRCYPPPPTKTARGSGAVKTGWGSGRLCTREGQALPPGRTGDAKSPPDTSS